MTNMKGNEVDQTNQADTKREGESAEKEIGGEKRKQQMEREPTGVFGLGEFCHFHISSKFGQLTKIPCGNCISGGRDCVGRVAQSNAGGCLPHVLDCRFPDR